MDENRMVQILDTCYVKALNGIPLVSESITELGDYYLKNYKSEEKAINKLIETQVKKCSANGFVTGLGGVATLPVTIPANMSSVLYIQLRMIASIAYISGYNVNSDEIKTMVYLCLVGSSVTDILKEVGLKVGNNFFKKGINKISGKALIEINKKVGMRLFTKNGTKGIINFGKLAPVVGGVLGGVVDYTTTRTIGNYAKKVFYENKENYEF